jgi:hypothetical protein
LEAKAERCGEAAVTGNRGNLERRDNLSNHRPTGPDKDVDEGRRPENMPSAVSGEGARNSGRLMGRVGWGWAAAGQRLSSAVLEAVLKPFSAPT